MKFNPFQKLTLVIYVIVIISIMIFIVPFKSFDHNEYSINYDFIWSNRKSIDFFRFSIFLLTPTIIFFLLIKYYQKYNNISNELYNKKLSVEKRVFMLYIFSIFVVFTFLLTSNFIHNKKIDEINVQILPIEKRLDEYSLKKDNRITFFDETNLYADLSRFKGSIPKFWNRMNEILKSDDNNIIQMIITETKDNKTFDFRFNNRNEFEKFILKNNYNNYDVETENIKDVLLNDINNERNKIENLKNKIYFFDDILRTLLVSNLLMIFILFILRPTFLFVGSIFKETK